MRSFFHRLALTFAMMQLSVSVVSAPTFAQDKPSQSLDTAIHDYIMRNPKVIREALAQAELDEQAERTKRVLRENSAALYQDDTIVVGASDAKVSIVEFFDYNCPYCRQVYPILRQFIADHPDVRLIQHDAAMLGKDSEAVARLAIAARRMGKFEVFHDALMRRTGRITEASAIEVARKIGLDVDLLRREAAAPEAAKGLASAKDLARRLSVEGTPLFIIGHDGISGSPDDWQQQMSKLVERVRQAGCDVCTPNADASR